MDREPEHSACYDASVTREELIVLVKRLHKGEFDDEELKNRWAEFIASVPHPDAANLLMERSLTVEQIVDYALAGERIEVQGMAVPVIRHPDGTRTVRFSDPWRIALHWAGSFRSVVENRAEYHDQGFGVRRTSERSDEARRRWMEWTGTDLGDDIYELSPAWSGERGEDLTVVVPRSFLLALYEFIDRERLHLPGGTFGRGNDG